MERKPLVSVIIPTYNREKYIEETVKNALVQTYENIEVIVIDDGSTDQTEQKIKEFNDSRVRYIWQENTGVSGARNKAILSSKGEFIALLDHDDIWLPEKLEKQIPLFNDPQVGAVFCDSIYFTNEGDLYSIYSKNKPPNGKIFRELLRLNNFISCETVIIRKEALDSLDELFPTDMHIVEEYDLFLRLAFRYEWRYVDEPLAKYRLHEEQFTRTRDDLLIIELKKLRKRIEKYVLDLDSYEQELEVFDNTVKFKETLFHWRRGEFGGARKLLLGLVGYNWRYFLLFPFMFFDYKYFDWVKKKLKIGHTTFFERNY
jgi:glycosyltransferase involved in cell wall biosynthesis